jgi:phosphonate metabolism protein PhnN/1,5-bisphosphokinase (PRPP-forming)
MGEAKAIATGTLLLVVGASGVGKDSLIRVARARLEGAEFAFPRRWITAPDDRGEGHLPVSVAEFERAVAQQQLVLHWEANSLRYGIPASIRQHLDVGCHVLANVSRSVIDDARTCFARVEVINVTAPPEVVRARLVARGREAGVQIEERLQRATAFAPSGEDVVTFCNDRPLAEAADAFLQLLMWLVRR